MANIVVVFDLDKTIIDCDSDNWVLDELGFTDLFNELLPTMPWNPLMDKMMKEMHERGVTINDIVEVLKRTPMHARIIPAIKSAHEAGCELKILSDANGFFIETILDHHGLRDYFLEIQTNSGYVDEDGRVRIFPYHNFTTTPHGCECTLCPPNMCKGLVLKELLSNDKDKTFIYLGDGNGDYCPCMRLRKGDYCMPRKDYPLWKVISSDPKLITADIYEWSDGEDLEPVLLSLINSLAVNKEEKSNNGSLQIIHRIDCKLIETIPMSSHETLTPAVLVPQ